jgi:ribose 5-phosphate isomerase B
VRIAVGSDHAGLILKELIAKQLVEDGYEISDLGTFTTESVDYPDFGAAVGRAVAAGEADFGVCCCGSGIGISIAANKVAGVRAALAHDVTSARLARLHNDANVVCFGERLTGAAVVLEAVQAFLTTDFEGGRHARRIEKITKLEEEL